MVFYALDGYFFNYPLVYKKKFQKVVESDFSKSKSIKDTFVSWGSRCWILPPEVLNTYVLEKAMLNFPSYFKELKQAKIIDEEKINNINLNINTEVLKDLGCNYIFSTKKFSNAQDKNLHFLNTFTDSESPWIIHLYEVM